MRYLPDTVFRSKDRRNPKSDRGDFLPSADLGLCLLYLHNVGKLRGRVLRYGLGVNDMAISDSRCGTLQGLINLLLSSRWENSSF